MRSLGGTVSPLDVLLTDPERIFVAVAVSLFTTTMSSVLLTPRADTAMLLTAALPPRGGSERDGSRRGGKKRTGLLVLEPTR